MLNKYEKIIKYAQKILLMRILLITPGVRGLASYCINLYKHLEREGHEVLIISAVKWHKQKVANLYEADSVLLGGLVPVVYRPGKLFEKIKEWKPDIIHYHWPTGSFDYSFGKLVNLGIPVVVTVHVAIGSRKFLFDKIWYYHFSRIVPYLPKAAATVSISKFVASQVDSRVKLAKGQHVLIYAGVDEKVFCPMPRKQDRALNILFVGQIMPEKGIDVLIDSVMEVREKKDIKLSIIGPGHMKAALQRKTKDCSYISWVGFLKEQKDIAAYYAKADATVLPTRWDEAFSLVPVESIACGTPVIASDKGGNPEIVTQKKTGFLLHKCDKAEIIRVLLAQTKKGLQGMRAGCRKSALRQYTLGKMGKDYEKLYRRLIASGKPGRSAR
jgi:glycosyltransferase involved in cell wall biosynthesis